EGRSGTRVAHVDRAHANRHGPSSAPGALARSGTAWKFEVRQGHRDPAAASFLRTGRRTVGPVIEWRIVNTPATSGGLRLVGAVRRAGLRTRPPGSPWHTRPSPCSPR